MSRLNGVSGTVPDCVSTALFSRASSPLLRHVASIPSSRKVSACDRPDMQEVPNPTRCIPASSEQVEVAVRRSPLSHSIFPPHAGTLRRFWINAPVLTNITLWVSGQ